MRVFPKKKRTSCLKRVNNNSVKTLSFFNKILFFLNSIVALLLLFSCIVPYISVEHFPFLYVFSLGVPVLVILNGIFLAYWLLSFKKQFLLSFIILVIGYFSLGSFVVFKDDSEVKINYDNAIKVLTFNSQGFHGDFSRDEEEINNEIIEFIEEQNPDILCFQEFDYKKVRSNEFSDYPYRYINFEYGVYTDKVIQGIYSKYPIVYKGSLDFPDSANNSIYIDVKYGIDTLRIYNVHLESLSVKPSSIKKENSEKLFKRLGNSFVKQQEQAELLVAHAREVSYKKIICGDFNNTQYSSVYSTIKGDKKDTFMEKGNGFGRTYDFKFIPLRIDFILVDQGFDVLSHQNYNEKLSDHYPVMTTLRLKNK